MVPVGPRYNEVPLYLYLQLNIWGDKSSDIRALDICLFIILFIISKHGIFKIHRTLLLINLIIQFDLICSDSDNANDVTFEETKF